MPKSKPVINLITGEYYVSASEAGRMLGLDSSDISKACRSWKGIKSGGKLRHSVGRYKWMYYEDYVEINDKNKIDLTLNNHNRCVIDIKSGKKYRSIYKASEAIGLNRNTVAKMLQIEGIYVIKDYILMYEDEYRINNPKIYSII